jgi:hypothetical protein
MNRWVALAAVAASVAASGVMATPALAAPAVAVIQGDHYGARIFPDNFFAVADAAQVSGLRVNFRAGVDYPACDSSNYSICDAFAMLDHLDGFDLQPRVTVPLTGAVDLTTVDDSNFYITDDGGTFVSGMRQLVFDPASNTLAGIADQFLREDTAYHVHVTSGIKDPGSNAISACGSGCDVRFTTRTASAGLVNIRKAMDLPLTDPNNAYVLAGFPGATTSTDGRKATFVQGGTPDVFASAQVKPSVSGSLPGGAGIVRNDNRTSIRPVRPTWCRASSPT